MRHSITASACTSRNHEHRRLRQLIFAGNWQQFVQHVAAHWSTTHAWVAPAGNVPILVGASSAAPCKRQRLPLLLRPRLPLLPRPLHRFWLRRAARRWKFREIAIYLIPFAETWAAFLVNASNRC
jgi:hypothetical protein